MLTESSQTRIASALLAMHNGGWAVTFPELATDQPPPVIAKRYPEIPRDYRLFLGMCGACFNPKNEARMFTNEVFYGVATGVPPWNACERASLDAGKPEAEVHAFWDLHLPVAHAPLAGPGFFALVTQGEKAGSVIHGQGPDFETSATLVAESFTELLWFIARGPDAHPADSAIHRALRNFQH